MFGFVVCSVIIIGFFIVCIFLKFRKNSAEKFCNNLLIKKVFVQIGVSPVLAIGMTYVFLQGWSSFVNFVAS